MADQIGDELTALPYIGNDPTTWLDPENDNELAPWGAVKALASGGEEGVVADLKELISRILPVGRMEFSPFRADSLPTGWYAMNGQTFLDTSPQGVALLGLPQSYRDDWGIVHGTDYMVNVPNFLPDGKGYFVRAVDGTERQAGSVEQDAMRKLSISSSGSGQGTFTAGMWNGFGNATGAFSSVSKRSPNMNLAGGDLGQDIREYTLNLSSGLELEIDGGVEFDVENRPLNIGMTPAIYLGV